MNTHQLNVDLAYERAQRAVEEGNYNLALQIAVTMRDAGYETAAHSIERAVATESRKDEFDEED